MYILELSTQPGGFTFIGPLLVKEMDRLKTLSFLDNEFGEEKASKVKALEAKIIDGINVRLRRGRKPYRLLDITPMTSKHHHIQFRCLNSRTGEIDVQTVDLYPPSRRSTKRKEEEADAESKPRGPRRGVAA